MAWPVVPCPCFQVYLPASNSWRTSGDSFPYCDPLPEQRGGTGKGVLSDGEIFVFGGETTKQPLPQPAIGLTIRQVRCG